MRLDFGPSQFSPGVLQPLDVLQPFSTRQHHCSGPFLIQNLQPPTTPLSTTKDTSKRAYPTMSGSPADPIYLPPLSLSNSAQTKHHLLVFLPGNPGYPGYYAPFLSALRAGLLSSPLAEDAVHIRCLTLPGFAPPPTDPQQPPNSPPPTQTSLLSLSETISALLTTILALRIPSGPRAGEPHDSLTLLGHSVGAYLALSVLSQLPATTRATTRAILLFPTITDIAQSPSGAVLAPLLRYVP
ncbi:hypothetical protein V496_10479, partial [Pseudogymnoascus sp. VKM F-4515 (FW-2607)]